MKIQEIELYLQRIKLESSYELNDILANLGIKETLQNSADFSFMTEAKPFFINKINQKIFFEMGEKEELRRSPPLPRCFCLLMLHV